MRYPMIEIVLVHVGVHPDPLLPKNLVVLRSGQRSQKKQFENVERQFVLDDLDVAQDRLLGVTRESDDIAGTGDGAVVAPFLQQLPIIGDLVLTLLCRDKIVRINVLQSYEHSTNSRLGRLLDEVWDFVTQRVNLDGKADVRAVSGAQGYQTIKQQFPIAVTREIVVGDEKCLIP